jgi:hypothetical protein
MKTDGTCQPRAVALLCNGNVRKSRLFKEFNIPTEDTPETFCMLFSMFLLSVPPDF